MSAAGYFALTRPVQAASAGVAAGIAYWICGGADILTAVLLFLSAACILGAGNTFNDCFDVDIDKIHRPDRPIPAGNATVLGGGILTAILCIAGFACSLPILPWCPWLAAVNILLLIAYSTSFKRMPVMGNLCVAYLSGSVFLFGGMAVGVESFFLTAPLFLMIFCVTLAREMIKDAEDIKNDEQAGAFTLPMLIGVQPTIHLSYLSLLIGVIVSYLPAFSWGGWYILPITAVNIFLLWSMKRAFSCTTSESLAASKAAMLTKIGIFLAILVFVGMEMVSRIL